MPLILILNSSYFSVDEVQLREIRSLSEGFTVATASHTDVPPDLLEKADIIFGSPSSDLLPSAGNLKWLQILSAGAERYVDISLYCNKDIILTNSRGVFGLPIAEHVLAMILSHNRDLMTAFTRKTEHRWEKGFTFRDFSGSTIGIIGLGDIGTEIARRSKALGARVVAVKRTPDNRPAYVDELLGENGIDALIEQSDYVIVALPSTTRTRGVLTRERIYKMKKDAFLVNIGRGALVDQDALIDALGEKRIGGAGLDVVAPEPLPPDSPLWSMSNVIITPHVSGNSPGNIERRLGIFRENLGRYMRGERLMNVVDFEKGY